MSPVLFTIAMDVITENAKEKLMIEILYVEDLVLMSKNIENFKEVFELESKGLKINFKKTKVTVSGSKGQVFQSNVDP